MRFRLALVFCLFGLPALFCSHAYADTYQSVFLHSDSATTIFGMDDNGVVILSNDSCLPQTCYYTFINGVSTGAATSVPPPIRFDFAVTPCDLKPCSLSLDGRTVTVQPPAVHDSNIYVQVGNGPLQLIGASNIGFEIALNGIGDIVLDDVGSEDWFELIDQTSRTVTPEPPSFLLLTTGLCLGMELFRRRQTKALA